MAMFPPASVPAEDHQASDDTPAPTPERDRTGQGTIGVAAGSESTSAPVLDLTDASRPMIIDLVRPEVAPPDTPVDGDWAIERLGVVGLLAAKPWQLATKRLIDIAGSLSLLILLSPVMLVIAALISGLLALFTWRHRRTQAAKPFVIQMLILLQWETSYILQVAATDLPTKLFWDKITFLGVVAMPVAWLVFAIEYIGRTTGSTSLVEHSAERC